MSRKGKETMNNQRYAQQVTALIARMNGLGDCMSHSRKMELYGWLQSPSPEVLRRVEQEIADAEVMKLTQDYHRDQREGTIAILGRWFAVFVMFLIGEGFIVYERTQGLNIFVAIGLGFLYFVFSVLIFAYFCTPVFDRLLTDEKPSDRKVNGWELPTKKPLFPGYEEPKK